MNYELKESFGSKIGAVLASAGSAVGLGNVWRFPTEVGNNGGAAFIFVYLICIAMIGIPVMMSEFLIGRHTHTNTIDAFAKLAPGKWWRIEGIAGVFVAFMILSYYIVISGWTLFYLVESLSGRLLADRDYSDVFNGFVSDTWMPILAGVAFMALTHVIIAKGVQSGIERFSKIMMPLLLFIIGILVVCSFSMPGSSEGLRFLLKPDFSKLTASVILSAVGQAFFSLSLAMGCLCTYASYFGKDVNIIRSAANISIIDTMVAIMSGLIIFPAVFSAGIDPQSGPSLAFIALPGAFCEAFSGVPMLASLISILFYALLVLAALTSAISLYEVPTAYIHETWHIRRRYAAMLVTVVCLLLGTVCSLSMGLWGDVQLFGKNIFDLLDYFCTTIMMPLSGVFIALFVGWVVKRSVFIDDVTNEHALRPGPAKLIWWLLRWVAPVLLLAAFLGVLGVI